MAERQVLKYALQCWLRWIKKLHRNSFMFCVGECKIPPNVKSRFSFFQNLNAQFGCLIFVKVTWIDAKSRCMQKKYEYLPGKAI